MAESQTAVQTEGTAAIETEEQMETEVEQEVKKASAQNRRYLRPREMFAFLLTSFGQKNLNQFINSYRQFFMISFLGLSGSAYGSIIMFESIYDALDDTISGLIVDRTRTRWGKLRPYLIITTPVWGLAILMMFSTPTFLTTTTFKVIWAVVAIFAHNLGMSYFNTFNILLYNVTPNINERNNLIAAQKFMELFGTWIPSFLPIFIDFLPGWTDNAVGQEDVYFGFAFIMVLISAGTAIYGFFVLRERVPLASREQIKSIGIWDSFKIAFKNRPMLVLQLNYFFNGFKSVGSSSEVFFWTHNAGKQSYATIAGLFTGIPNYIIVPLAPKIIRKIGARNAGVLAGLFGGVAYTLLFLIGYKPFGEWDNARSIILNMITITLMLTICGLPNQLINVVGAVLQGDVYDYGEWKYGVRNEALIATVSGYFQKLANAVTGLLSGVVITWVGYEARTDVFGNVVRETDSSVLYGFWILFCLLPAFARFMYGVSLLFFNVRGEFKRQMLKDLEERRAEKIAAMQEGEASGTASTDGNGAAPAPHDTE